MKTHSSTLRAVIVAAAVALTVGAGVLSAGATVKGKKSAARAPRTKADTSHEVLARVADVAITRADFDARIADLPPQYRSQFATPDAKRQFLDRMIEERVWLLSAERARVQDKPDIRKQIEGQRRDLLIRTYLGGLMAEAPAPSDSAVQEWYAGHPNDYKSEERVKVAHIQLTDEKEAQRIKKEIARGLDFAEAAKKYSKDSVTKDKGGDLGEVAKSGFFGSLGRQPALAESAFTAPVNVVGGPYQTGLGWHLIRVSEKIPSAVRPLEEVKPLIVRQLTQSANQDWYQKKLLEAKAAVQVNVDSAAVDSFVTAQKSAAELFREAGDVPAPDDRIVAYQRVASTHPESEFAPQALFMVGFVESEEKRDYDKAEQAFRDLLTRYPKSELVPSAQWMIDNMRSDKTPDFDLPGGMGKASEHDSPARQPAGTSTRP